MWSLASLPEMLPQMYTRRSEICAPRKRCLGRFAYQHGELKVTTFLSLVPHAYHA